METIRIPLKNPKQSSSNISKREHIISKVEAFKATGRRKCAIARVIMKKGTGKRTVNGKSFEEYFPGATIGMIINQPFTTLECADQWDVIVNANGGGITGQAEATRLGIARALLLTDEANRRPLRAGGFLTRDPRIVQRKMYGRAKARKRFQFSKR